MRQIEFNPDNLEGPLLVRWTAWRTAAAAARVAVEAQIQAGEKPDFKSGVWTELKNILLEGPYRQKCGYCESVGVTAPFDADHFRPKSRVRQHVEEDAPQVQCGGAPHPGYYWLAFEWENLIPSCIRCNRQEKLDFFPVAKANICDPSMSPDALDAMEEPLLINPYKENPEQYLIFDAQGKIGAIDGNPRGKASIEAHVLDDETLTTERKDAAELALSRVLDALSPKSPEAFTDVWDRETSSSHKYSAAIAWYVETALGKLRDRKLLRQRV